MIQDLAREDQPKGAPLGNYDATNDPSDLEGGWWDDASKDDKSNFNAAVEARAFGDLGQIDYEVAKPSKSQTRDSIKTNKAKHGKRSNKS